MKALPPAGGPSWFFCGPDFEKLFTILKPKERADPPGLYPVADWQGVTGYLFGGVSNLTGEFYEESAGVPMPVQTSYGGVQWRY